MGCTQSQTSEPQPLPLTEARLQHKLQLESLKVPSIYNQSFVAASQGIVLSIHEPSAQFTRQEVFWPSSNYHSASPRQKIPFPASLSSSGKQHSFRETLRNISNGQKVATESTTGADKQSKQKSQELLDEFRLDSIYNQPLSTPQFSLKVTSPRHVSTKLISPKAVSVKSARAGTPRANSSFNFGVAPLAESQDNSVHHVHTTDISSDEDEPSVVLSPTFKIQSKIVPSVSGQLFKIQTENYNSPENIEEIPLEPLSIKSQDSAGKSFSFLDTLKEYEDRRAKSKKQYSLASSRRSSGLSDACTVDEYREKYMSSRGSSFDHKSKINFMTQLERNFAKPEVNSQYHNVYQRDELEDIPELIDDHQLTRR